VALYEPILEALNRNQVRYVVVGGVAVVLHGYARLTADLDLAVDLLPREARRAVGTLVNLGFLPRAPVDPYGFAEPSIRTRWMAQPGVQGLSMRDQSDPSRTVDVLGVELVPFGELWDRSDLVCLRGTAARVASVRDLITLKRLAARPEDQIDIEALEAISNAGRGWMRQAASPAGGAPPGRRIGGGSSLAAWRPRRPNVWPGSRR